MTKQETIQVLQNIEDRAIKFPNMTECDWVAIAAAKRHLQEEPVSEDLEEEIHKEVIKLHTSPCYDELKAFALHFIEWQKEQMMANTADAMIGLPYENKDGGYTQLIDVSRPLPVGNNKIAIIFKEE